MIGWRAIVPSASAAATLSDNDSPICTRSTINGMRQCSTGCDSNVTSSGVETSTSSAPLRTSNSERPLGCGVSGDAEKRGKAAPSAVVSSKRTVAPFLIVMAVGAEYGHTTSKRLRSSHPVAPFAVSSE